MNEIETTTNEELTKPRGRPFAPGNPGRPPGSKNKTTRMLEQLIEGQAEQCIEKLKELALAGDVTCLKIIIDRLIPLRKSQPINLGIPPINARKIYYLLSHQYGTPSATESLHPKKQLHCAC